MGIFIFWILICMYMVGGSLRGSITSGLSCENWFPTEWAHKICRSNGHEDGVCMFLSSSWGHGRDTYKLCSSTLALGISSSNSFLYYWIKTPRPNQHSRQTASVRLPQSNDFPIMSSSPTGLILKVHPDVQMKSKTKHFLRTLLTTMIMPTYI